jgi:hypothetical protein
LENIDAQNQLMTRHILAHGAEYLMPLIAATVALAQSVVVFCMPRRESIIAQDVMTM